MAPNQAFSVLPTSLRRYGLLAVAGLGAVLLAIAEFSTLYEVVVVTAVPRGGHFGTGGHHGYALLLIALLALVMAWGAVAGGSRPAAFALVVLGAAALFVVLAVDLPDVHDEGLLAETYEDAKASPRSGFYLEAIGAVLVLLAGVGTVLFGLAARAPRESRRRRVVEGEGDVAAVDAPGDAPVPAER